MIKGLHHFGFAIVDLEVSISTFEKQGYQVFKRFEYAAIGAKAAMLRNATGGVELWQFKDFESSLAQKIKKHFAFESDNLEEDIQKFLSAGYEISIPISNGNVVKRYVYVQDELGNQIELVEPFDAS